MEELSENESMKRFADAIGRTAEEMEIAVAEMNALIQSMAAGRIDEKNYYSLQQPYESAELNRRTSFMQIANKGRKSKW